MDSLFDAVGRPEQEAFLRRLQAFAAPIVRDRGSIVEDPDLIDVAFAVYAAFGDAGVSGGLTRAQIASACAGACDTETFDSRFEVFVGHRMLLPVVDKAHQQRYIFNMASGAGLLVWDRLAEHGGVDELINLLDRTQEAMKNGHAGHDEVAASLRSCRHWLTVAADHLMQMVTASPLSELIAVRRHHSQEGLIERVNSLNQVVADTFPDLEHQAFRLLQSTYGYLRARERFVERLLDEGGNARDFSLLDHEEYLAAALTRSLSELAETFAGVVFDPPGPWLDATSLTEALDAQKPRPPGKQRPPRPTPRDGDEDPLLSREKTATDHRKRRDDRIDFLLQGDRETEVASFLRNAGWPSTAIWVADLLAASADPASPYTVHLSNELLVDPDGDVTYLTPLMVLRTETGEVFDVGMTAMFEESQAEDGVEDPLTDPTGRTADRDA